MKKKFSLLFLLFILSFSQAVESKMSIYFKDIYNNHISSIELENNRADFNIVFYYRDKDFTKNEIFKIDIYKKNVNGSFTYHDELTVKIRAKVGMAKYPYQIKEPGIYNITFRDKNDNFLGEDVIVVYSPDGDQRQAYSDVKSYVLDPSSSTGESAKSTFVYLEKSVSNYVYMQLKTEKGKVFIGNFEYRVFMREREKWTKVQTHKFEVKKQNPYTFKVPFSGSGKYLFEFYDRDLNMVTFILLNVNLE